MSVPNHDASEPRPVLPLDSNNVSEPRLRFSTENHLQSSGRIDPMISVDRLTTNRMNYILPKIKPLMYYHAIMIKLVSLR